MSYVDDFNPSVTPQSEQAGPAQVPNSAGGYTFQLDKWKRLERFLILGSDSQTYYATAQQLTRENAKCVLDCLAEDFTKCTAAIVGVSTASRAPKNDAAIFALALAASYKPASGDMLDVVCNARWVEEAVPQVCRTAPHLFAFVDAVNEMRGWGPSIRRAVGNWYVQMPADKLAYQITKYPSRKVGEGKKGRTWSHRDVLRLTHPEADDAQHQLLLRYIVAGPGALGQRAFRRHKVAGHLESSYPPVGELTPYLAAVEELKACGAEPKVVDLGGGMPGLLPTPSAAKSRAVELIKAHKFGHEHVPHALLAHREVWEALAEHMPLGALLRHLGKLTANGVLAPLSEACARVCAKLTSPEAIKGARLHPLDFLKALLTYRQGHGDKGKLTWQPVPQVVDALDAGFYAAFGTVEPTGKNLLLAIDVSGSMDCGSVGGVAGLTPRMAAACMAMVTARVEKHWHMVGFSARDWRSRFANESELVTLGITPDMTLTEACAVMRKVPMGGTDCALPMIWAKNAIALGAKVDAFVILTDSETWAGNIHPHQALRDYRLAAGVPAKLAVLGMTATSFTIADPSDPGQLDLVGVDSGTPHVLSEFIRG